MSEAYERERYVPRPLKHRKHIQLITPSTRQNNDSLASLQAKVSQLRSVTVDIYDNARDQHVIDNTSESFSNMATSIKGSARRLGVMASQGNKIAVFKLAGIIVATVVVLWWILSWFW
jgi:blocked-early-in-transport protein 1